MVTLQRMNKCGFEKEFLFCKRISFNAIYSHKNRGINEEGMTLSCHAITVKKRWACSYRANLGMHRSWFRS